MSSVILVALRAQIRLEQTDQYGCVLCWFMCIVDRNIKRLCSYEV